VLLSDIQEVETILGGDMSYKTKACIQGHTRNKTPGFEQSVIFMMTIGLLGKHGYRQSKASTKPNCQE
jgi:hypothetical protein